MGNRQHVFGEREGQADEHGGRETVGEEDDGGADVFGDIDSDSTVGVGGGDSETGRSLLSDGGSDRDPFDDTGSDDGLLSEDELLSGGGDVGATELSYRLDDVEEEVNTLQNRVEIFRGENERISNRVETVDKNVEKLVDLYEIVTRGINPFVGDQELGNAFDTEGGTFGAQQGTDVDDDLAAADADDFLDDDFDDVVAEDAEAFDDDFDDDGGFVEDLGDGRDALDDDPNDSGDGFELAFDESEVDRDDETGSATSDDGRVESPNEDDPLNGEFGEPPYLVTHRARDDVELVTLEWLQFLVEKSGVQGAARTIAYYESVGWISQEAAGYLQSMLDGFGTAQQRVGEVSGDARSPLSVTEHKRSLQYIAWIATPDQAPDLGAEMDETAADETTDAGNQ